MTYLTSQNVLAQTSKYFFFFFTEQKAVEYRHVTDIIHGYQQRHTCAPHTDLFSEVTRTAALLSLEVDKIKELES